MTHIEALDLDRLPAHLIVMGGGYVGLELAQAMRRFGSHVTVIERDPQLASREDPDVGAALLELFHDEGIEVSLVPRSVGSRGVRPRASGSTPRTDRASEASKAPISSSPRAGRRTRMGSDSSEAGVELTGHGYIRVTSGWRRPRRNVWAMGDCAGSPHFTHAAYHDFRVVHDNLNGGNRTTKDRSCRSVCSPIRSWRAWGEMNQRRDATGSNIVWPGCRWRMCCARGRCPSRAASKNADRRAERRDPGIHRVGVEASELMAAVQTAMVGRMPFTMLRDAIFAHPTVSEGWSFCSVTSNLARPSVRAPQKHDASGPVLVRRSPAFTMRSLAWGSSVLVSRTVDPAIAPVPRRQP